MERVINKKIEIWIQERKECIQSKTQQKNREPRIGTNNTKEH